MTSSSSSDEESASACSCEVSMGTWSEPSQLNPVETASGVAVLGFLRLLVDATGAYGGRRQS